MIRVLQVVGKMHYGGMETFIMNVYRHIDREKVQFDFLVHYDEPGEYDDEIRRMGGKIYHMPRTVPQNYFKYKKALLKFFTEHQEYKIIHGHLHSVAYIYHDIAKRTGDRVCITHAHANGYDKNPKSMLAYYMSLLAQKNTDIFFGCSKEACEKFFPKAIRQGKKTVIVKNGIDVGAYRYSKQTDDAVRREQGLSNNFVIGHIGRFSPAKNHEFLLRIFSEIVRKKPESRLVLVGKGPLEQNIRALADELSLTEHIVFLGARSDVPRLLQGMDVFLLPSLYEGLGIVLVEAQAAGLKCFASDTVSKEAEVTDLLTYCELERSAEYWADKVLASIPYEREDKTQDIISSGFDINETAAMLEQFYLKA